MYGTYASEIGWTALVQQCSLLVLQLV